MPMRSPSDDRAVSPARTTWISIFTMLEPARRHSGPIVLVRGFPVQTVWLLVLTLGFQPTVQADDQPTDQARALAEVKKLGGKYEVDAKAPGSPVIKVNLTRTKTDDKKLATIVKGCPQLQALELEATNVTDAGLVHLEGLTRLKQLTLINTEIGDAGLAHLKKLTQLQRLDLSATKIRDAGLVHLKGLANLRELSLGLTKVTDKGLVHLHGLTQLRKLDLFLTKVTDAGARELRKALPRVEITR